MTELNNTDGNIYWGFFEKLNYVLYLSAKLSDDNEEMIQYYTELEKSFLRKTWYKCSFFFPPGRLKVGKTLNNCMANPPSDTWTPV